MFNENIVIRSLIDSVRLLGFVITQELAKYSLYKGQTFWEEFY